MRGILLLLFYIGLSKKALNREHLVYTDEGFEYIYQEGDRGLISCPLYQPGENQLLIWEKDGYSGGLNNTINRQTLSNGTLSIMMRVHHTGTYHCFVINAETGEKMGEPSKPIIIKKAYLDKHFTPRQQEVSERPNHEVQLNCAIGGIPAPQISWHRELTKRFKRIRPENKDGYQIMYNYNAKTHQATSKLIMNLDQKHHGNYRCAGMKLKKLVILSLKFCFFISF